jgi:gentisate 1,2-dioxygenase
MADATPPDSPVTLRYVDPTSGRAPLPTMSAEAHWLRPGERTPGERRTTSRIFHVIEGRGQSRVGESVLAWEAGDTFVAPPWQWLEHEHRGDGPACLFQFDDEPVLQALGLWQEEVR